MNKFATSLTLIVANTVLLFTSACVSDQVLKGTTSTRAKSANANIQLPTQVPGVPKPTLAVTGFTNQAGYRSQYNLGKNLETMLESAMVDTRSFRVVDRTALGSVLAEQRLKKTGASVGEGAQSGGLAAARYIVEGAITEVSENVQGTGGGIRVPIGGTRIGLGGEYTRAQLTAIIKVIDTTTGEVVAKETVRGKSGNASVDIKGRDGRTAGSFGTFAKTPVAEAAQDVINQAAAFATQAVHDHYRATGGGYAAPPPAAPPQYTYPPQASAKSAALASGAAKVALVNGNEIFINRGAEHGMTIGRTMSVGAGGGTPVLDPDTGAVIGMVGGAAPTSRIQITNVEAKMSRAVLVEGVMPSVGQEAR